MANTGNIIKVKCETDFSMFFNSVLRDDRLSLRARGLLVYLVSLPYDWIVQKATLDELIFPDVIRVDDKGVRVQGEKREGRDAIFSAFDELIKFKYVEVEKKVNAENGRIEGFNYSVYSQPKTDNPKTDSPVTDFPNTDNPQLTKDILIQSKKRKQRNNNIKKEENGLPVTREERLKVFVDKVKPFLEKYGEKMLTDFVDYWSELADDGKMRFEKKDIFEISLRLSTWYKNTLKFNK